MSFSSVLDNLALRKSAAVRRFERLIEPQSDAELEAMAQTSHALTLQNFGRTMRLFAPLYLSNECINNCRYCGFSRDNPILRVTLSVEEVLAEARFLRDSGFRQLLLVAGEHPKFVSENYLLECICALAPDFPSISIEVGPSTIISRAQLDELRIHRIGGERPHCARHGIDEEADAAEQRISEIGLVNLAADRDLHRGKTLFADQNDIAGAVSFIIGAVKLGDARSGILVNHFAMGIIHQDVSSIRFGVDRKFLRWTTDHRSAAAGKSHQGRAPKQHQNRI